LLDREGETDRQGAGVLGGAERRRAIVDLLGERVNAFGRNVGQQGGVLVGILGEVTVPAQLVNRMRGIRADILDPEGTLVDDLYDLAAFDCSGGGCELDGGVGLGCLFFCGAEVCPVLKGLRADIHRVGTRGVGHNARRVCV
jgi:hypothetical protein